MLANASIGEDPGMDFAAEGLLDGLEGEERVARQRLLEQLVHQGYTLDQLRAAVAEERLVLLGVERVLGGRYTTSDVERLTGVSARLMLRIRRLAGLPEPGADELVFGEEDLAVARSTRLFLEAGLSEQAVEEMTRVLGEAMGRVAATTTGMFVEAFLRPGDSEHDLAERFAQLTEQLVPALEPVLIATFKAHLREAIRRGMIGRAQRESGRVEADQIVAVCFADVVGFTRLGAQIEVQELGEVAGMLAQLAAELTEPPVRLVKTIGDAAMFVSPEPGALVAVALALVQAFLDAELPTLRAGVALGPALQRAGDFYGHSVNLASRVTGIARPESVLVTQEVHDAAGERFAWSFAGRHRLKGVGVPVVLYRARLRK
jgi:adenylate cyclase